MATIRLKLNAFIPVSDGKRERAEQLEFSTKAEVQRSVAPEPVASETPMPVKDAPVEKQPRFMRIEYPGRVPTQTEAPGKSLSAAKSDAVTPSTERTYDIKPVIEKQEIVVKTEPVKDVPVSDEQEEKACEYRIIGEAFYSYVFVETGDSVLIIDKHAAHERILFEELKRNLKKADVASQLLLVPIDIVMTDVEADALREYSEEIKKTGFEFELYGNTVSITQTPIELDGEAVVLMLQTIAGRLADGTGNVSISRDIIYEKALFQASCKAAVKIGHVHDDEHLKWICERVIALDIIKFCPHGRPVAFELTKRDFERQFKRI